MARILVVDDQITVQKMIEGILLSAGHQITSVATAIDALDKLENYTFELMITDVMMPGGITGFELTQSVRKNEKYGTLPIIILTGRREPKNIEKGIDAGTDDYVIKPIDPAILISKVDSLLAKKGTSPATFMSAGVKESASWKTKLEIVSISEVGLTLHSELAAVVNSKIMVHSEIFTKIGISPPHLRVAKCQAPSDSANLFLIEAHFVGLSEKSLQPLRLWIRSYLLKKSA